ncbi:hypothetical protein [Parageobacillus thermoglucosidasius]|uniref:hypothetical protein n=1 Tax=Parageobacillus thermoglucosidasius TaxID=1426 RepID=UPI000B56664D|nr:hypothetical protein [Parageobacillus thermoglucosidasius]MBY6269773.1 hypothetical protein [Parageobacillus thermoglucosidasius]OUM84950.1 MAG: hypothetical protein BAA00_02520 [Parageobacillus thermoglucosidasius]
MPEKSLFFDSTAEDPREYTADEFAEYFRQVLTDGIFNGGTNLQVTADGTNMNVNIADGYAWIQGYMYKVYDGHTLTLDTADPTYDRIDRIVLRLDKSLEKRSIEAVVLKGTPSATPTPPALTRNENVYELSLAQVRVIAGKSYIESFQITDERLNTSVCGLVNSLITVDTNTFQEQVDAFLEYAQNQLEQVDVIRIDNHLQTHDAQIAELQTDVADHETRITINEKKLADYNVFSSGYDDNDIATVVELKRPDGTLYIKSVLSNPDSNGNYLSRTETEYAEDGSTVVRTTVYTRTYDTFGRFVSEVEQ